MLWSQYDSDLLQGQFGPNEGAMAFTCLPKTESPSIHLLFGVGALSLLLCIVAQAMAFLSVLAYEVSEHELDYYYYYY